MRHCKGMLFLKPSCRIIHCIDTDEIYSQSLSKSCNGPANKKGLTMRQNSSDNWKMAYYLF